MEDKDWDDIPYVDGDCIRDEAEWTSMITYIKHSASIDFTIYDDEASSNQVFRFTQDGIDSKMYGGSNTGDDLFIWGNDNASAVNIALLNTGEFNINDGANTFLSLYESGTDDVIEGKTAGNDLKIASVEGIHNYIKVGEEFKLFNGATEILKINYSNAGGKDITEIYGNTGNTSDDRLKIYACSGATYPYLLLVGDDDVQFRVATGCAFRMYDHDTPMSYIMYAANVTTLGGGNVSGDDLTLKANGIDALPYVGLDGGGGNVRINGAHLSAHYDLALLGDGVLCIKESATPTADTNYGKLYCKNDNHLYFQDGAGVEHQIV